MQRGGEEMLDDLDLAWEEQESGRKRRGGPPPRQVRQRRRKEKKRRRRSFVALFISVVLLATLGGAVYWGVGKVQDIFGAPDYVGNPAKVPVNVTVNNGDFASDIAKTLYDKKVVKSVKAYTNAATADPKGNTVQPGTYKLFEEMPANAALAMLLDPEKNMVTNKVTIPEGKTVIDTFALLSKATGIPVDDFKAAAQDPVKNLNIPDYWYKRDDGKQADVSIEGFLFPDTYSFQPDSTAQSILKAMVNRFLTVAGDLKFTDTVQAIGVTPYEALIVASMAQVEAGSEGDMPKVARVAYNRAVKGLVNCQCLQFDVTTNYWLQKQGKPTKASKDMTTAELNDAANPYNTGTNSKGLPLGPISNPGKAALQGAMAPPPANWIYFVAVDSKGTTKFSETDAQFARDKQESCRNGIIACSP
jgi:UPF0755 protein